MVRNTSVKISGQTNNGGFLSFRHKAQHRAIPGEKKGGVEDILFWKPSWNFLFFYFTPGNSRQKRAPSLEIPQSCVTSLGNGLYQKKKQKRGFEDMEFSGGIEERKYGNSSGKLRKKQNFQRCSKVKTHVKFRWVLVFHRGISKRCHTILLNFQGRKLVFTGISKGIVTNLKFPGGVQKIISSTPPIWFFSGIAQFQFPNPRPLEIPHYFFLVTPRNSTSFLINPWKFDILFLWYPWMEIPYPQPPCLVFFFGIAHLKLSF